MARVKYLTKDDLAEDDRPLLERSGINLFRALANNPSAARAFAHLGSHIRNGSELDGRIRELAILTVGWLARSPYEWSHHIRIGYDFGVSEADIEGLIAEAEGRDSDLDPLAKLACRAAREMTLDGAVADATFDALEGHLGHDLIIELVLAVATYNAVVRILGSLQIDVEDAYMPYLERFPLPEK
ncbi:carboxymuconolactone decarboxylase family protein [Minwuia thermotolerans]|uniref:Carboxymuconolactone decarboxylase family protein n=1 Tax=Minwuia thermotolerans TaxID=2056226 RepID=A0A2M9G5G5_9PROT|nr:carboxymuconolactone decarboxylase family protein [Minwuia thermotolerans]PJK30906.1 carboxymuconolactone decarboxylase family protein [Minwuia thermotolerans]